MDQRIQHNPAEMTARRKKLLQLLVREYVDSGKPVGSATLVTRFDTSISSATRLIRRWETCAAGGSGRP